MYLKAVQQEYVILTNLLRKYNYDYHTLDGSEISDDAYDSLFLKLRELETILGDRAPAIMSPTKLVGATPNNSFKITDHVVPMLSIGNVYNEDELRAFHWGIVEKIGVHAAVRGGLEYCAELKYDGVALSLIYEKGYLTTAVTRGNGFAGEDVTENAKTIGNIPLILPDFVGTEVVVEIRGEVIVTRQAFNLLNARLAERGLKPFATPRNTASGSLRLLNPEETRLRPLRFKPYRLIYRAPACPLYNLETQEQVLDWFHLQGFDKSELFTVAKSVEELMEFYRLVETKRDSLEFDIDGVVVKINNLSFAHLVTESNPTVNTRVIASATAFKFLPTRKITLLRDVTWQMGKTGVLTPVGILVAVNIAGVSIEAVNLYNTNEIRRLGITKNCYVEISRAGDVIPVVTKVISGTNENIITPVSCPSCNNGLYLINSELTCIARQWCPDQILYRLVYFASQQGLNIRGLGYKLLDSLLKAHLISGFDSLYFLTLEDILSAEIPGVGRTSATKILKQLELSKKVDLSRFLAAITIRQVGRSMAFKLARAFPTVDDLFAASKLDLASKQIDGLGAVTVDNIVDFTHNPVNTIMLQRLKEVGFTFPNPDYLKSTNGLKVVITGTFPVRRDCMVSSLNAAGYEVCGTVTADTHAVIAGADSGSKLTRAKELNIPIYSKEDREFSFLF